MSRPCEERERQSNPGAKCWTTEGFPLDGFASLAMTASGIAPAHIPGAAKPASGSQGKGLNALSFALDPGAHSLRFMRPGMWCWNGRPSRGARFRRAPVIPDGRRPIGNPEQTQRRSGFPLSRDFDRKSAHVGNTRRACGRRCHCEAMTDEGLMQPAPPHPTRAYARATLSREGRGRANDRLSRMSRRFILARNAAAVIARSEATKQSRGNICNNRAFAPGLLPPD